MEEGQPKRPGWKARLIHEMIAYWVIFAYLWIFLAVFAWHRRLILLEHDVSITDLWVPAVEAAVLAKVVLVLDMLRLSHRLEDRPLIVTTLYKTLFFSLGIAMAGAVEFVVRDLAHHQSLSESVNKLVHGGLGELLARCLVKFCALIPFFAFREVGRVLGRGRLAALFLKGPGRATMPT